MSLIGYQTAIAALIRYPRGAQSKNFAAFVAPYDLSETERSSLRLLSRIPQVTLYGQEQAEQRWESIEKHAVRTFRSVKRATLRSLWQNSFEPASLDHETDLEGRLAYTLGYLKFLQSNRLARAQVRSSAPEFIFELIACEVAELELMRPLLDEARLTSKSELAHGNFRIVDLKRDIATLLAAAPTSNDRQLNAMKLARRNNTLLFVRRGARQGPRIFEIDAAMRSFLTSQLEGHVPLRVNKSIRSDLQHMGLI